MSDEMIERSAADTLALLDKEAGLPDANVLAEITKVGDFLPYIQLCSSNTKECKTGQFPMGHFALRENKQFIDLGTEFIVMLLALRPKAMQFKPNVAQFFDPTTPQFKQIQAEADVPNSHKCFGPEFFVWLPVQQKFATYYLGNKTGRNESPSLIACMSATRVCKQKSELIENKDHSWHGPKTLPYDLPITQPPLDELQKLLEKFKNPPAVTVEPAEAAENDTRR